MEESLFTKNAAVSHLGWESPPDILVHSPERGWKAKMAPVAEVGLGWPPTIRNDDSPTGTLDAPEIELGRFFPEARVKPPDIYRSSTFFFFLMASKTPVYK